MTEHLTPSTNLPEHDASQYIGCKPQTLRAWRHRKQGPPYIMLGRAIRYRVQDLDAWLDANRVVPRPKHESAMTGAI
jgi:Helix-turn-helix domain